MIVPATERYHSRTTFTTQNSTFETLLDYPLEPDTLMGSFGKWRMGIHIHPTHNRL